MPGSKAYTRATGIQATVGIRRDGCEGEADGGSGGGTYRGGRKDRLGRDIYRLSLWEDNAAKLTIGTEPNDPLEYSPGLEHRHPIIVHLGILESG